jgi:hypothetical protein
MPLALLVRGLEDAQVLSLDPEPLWGREGEEYRARDVTQVVEYLPSEYEALTPNPGTAKKVKNKKRDRPACCVAKTFVLLEYRAPADFEGQPLGSQALTVLGLHLLP